LHTPIKRIIEFLAFDSIIFHKCLDSFKFSKFIIICKFILFLSIFLIFLPLLFQIYIHNDFRLFIFLLLLLFIFILIFYIHLIFLNTILGNWFLFIDQFDFNIFMCLYIKWISTFIYFSVERISKFIFYFWTFTFA
jgi:hypothetical protein